MKRVLLGSLALALAVVARAEVAVRTVGQHQFKSFRSNVHTQDGKTSHWDRAGGPPEDDYLNELGDARGDHPPVAVVIPAGVVQADPTPLVVWSRVAGGDLDIYWSIWTTAAGWREPARLSFQNDDDDLDVQLLLGPKGDVHAVWWTNGGIPGVWHAKFSGGAWGAPQQISNPLRDCRLPSLKVTSEAYLVIAYYDWTAKPVRVENFLSEHLDP